MFFLKTTGKDTFFLRKKQTMTLKKKPYEPERPLIMGILNCTEDSFFDGGRYLSETQILKRTEEMLSQGADIIDIGAVSTRPGAKLLPVADESEKIRNAVTLVRREFPESVISVDTCFAEPARVAAGCGADMINDISGGLFDEKMFQTVAELQMPYVLTHNRALPEDMQRHTDYGNITQEVVKFLSAQLEKLYLLGAKDVIIDPGFGFAKTLEQNYELMRNLDTFSLFDEPLLVGISRKSMIYKTLDKTPETSLNGTSVLNTFALLHGASILRVHDVSEAVECVKITSRLRLPKQTERPSFGN